MPFANIYKHLLNIHQVSLTLINPIHPPYLKWYNANAKCEYYRGVVGHFIENYPVFKNKIIALIKYGWISFNRPNGSSNINSNLLPTHTSTSSSIINVIKSEKSMKPLELDGIKMPIRVPFDKLIKTQDLKFVFSSHNGLLDNSRVCEYHPNTTSHTIKECKEFKKEVKRLITFGMLREKNVMPSKKLSFSQSHHR